LVDWVKLLRPHQWLKNLLLFFPPLLDGTISHLYVGIQPFIAFCAAASFTYVVNDIVDIEQDRLHPRKKDRPLACGRVGIRGALVISGLLLVVSILMALMFSWELLGWLSAYLGLQVAYSFYLKNQPILDIFSIASGFVIRLFAGSAVFSIQTSSWLFLSVLLLALFLCAGKRLAEMNTLGGDSQSHRRVLEKYPPGFLEGVMFMSGSSVLVTYVLYAITRQTLIYSVPICAYGLFRFVYCVLSGREGDPTEALLHDHHLLVVAIIWLAMVIGGVYGG